ncbi:MAG: Zn-ribbon domain-containing OB-fold protein [Tepidanaerobacteraceae bacterium]|jgi:uncharacterized OB-fold protein
MVETSGKKRVPICKGLLTDSLSELKNVRLLGTKCNSCGEVGLGKLSSCQNCAGEDLEVIPLSNRGTLWTYTVIRHVPPGDFKGKVPMGEGLVELPEGIRVKTPLGVDIEKIEIGMPLEFKAYPLYENENGEEVIAFRFDPIEQ